MTQQEAINHAYRQLPNPKEYADDWCTIRFNSDKIHKNTSNGYLRVDQNHIKNFNSELPFEVPFHKVSKDGSVQWEISNMNFDSLEQFFNKEEL